MAAIADIPPVPADQLAAALRPLGQATMLPAAAYTSAEVLRWELRHLFADSWVCVGRADELRQAPDGAPATQRGLQAGDVAVVLTFVDGAIHALANTCRHRGHELVPVGSLETRHSVLCPYHAWNYSLDGALVRAPGFSGATNLDPAQYGLTPLPVAVWHGWVFVNATGRGPAFGDHVGDLEGLVGPYRPESLVLGARQDYDVSANWKVLVENYHECYHCPLIHPELCRVSPPASGVNYDLRGAWVGGTMALRDGVATMSLDGRSRGVPIPGVDAGVVLYLGLFPNMLISLHPDYAMTHRLTPVAAGQTHVECSWYFVDSAADSSYAVEFWDLTNRQDWSACESVQRGLSSPHFLPGPFAPNEDAVHRWVTMVARAYQGVPPRAAHHDDVLR